MRVAVAVVAVLLAATSPGCGSRGQADDNKLEVYVDALIAESGPLADDAANALVAHGRKSIVILETGLYRADPDARRRIVRTLVRIGDRASIPILEHLAELDADADVREAARLGLERLNSAGASESK